MIQISNISFSSMVMWPELRMMKGFTIQHAKEITAKEKLLKTQLDSDVNIAAKHSLHLSQLI
jgi:hypothetical protein